jgi:transcriptional regulator with XRE-family HTH domain
MPEWVGSPIHRELIAALVRARKAANLTQRELAGRLGRPRSYVGKVEVIERNLSVLEFIEWARALGMNPKDILAKLKN